MNGLEFNPHPEASSEAREYVRDGLAKISFLLGDSRRRSY